MASYKAEFLSHYYQTHRRPRQALTMGRIGDWAPLAARIPRLVNFFTQTPGLSKLTRLVGGVARERAFPKFSNKSYCNLHHDAATPSPSGRQSLALWVDPVSDYPHPEVAPAAKPML